MKQFLIATAALSLIGGAAFAQTTAATPGAYASPGSTLGAQAGTDPQTGTNDANAQSATNGGTSTTQTMPAPAPAPAPSASTPDTSSTTMASNAPAGSPPSSYPICTSKHEDRCVNRSQATRMASNGMRTHHMKSMSSSTTTTTDQTQPAATPGL